MVQITKAERNNIIFTLLNDGVMCVKQEMDGTHPDTKIDNLKVWMVTKRLYSKGFLNVTFSWRHYYYTLNTDGIEYIKKTLGITADNVQPETHKTRKEEVEERPQRDGRGRGRGRGGRGRGRRGRGGERRPQNSE